MHTLAELTDLLKEHEYKYFPPLDISILEGKTLTLIINDKNQALFFITSTNEVYALTHYQQCCENVELEDICGDLSDLLNSPILSASKETNSDIARSDYDESYTWTFYKLATIRGSVTLRWYGTSNGYYSEEVDFRKLF